jgi:hypothetical protein
MGNKLTGRTTMMYIVKWYSKDECGTKIESFESESDSNDMPENMERELQDLIRDRDNSNIKVYKAVEMKLETKLSLKSKEDY